MAEAYADARTAPLGKVTGMAPGLNGDVYFSCRDLRRVFRLTAAGRLEVWAGSGKPASERWVSERDARRADLGGVEGLVVDGNGDLFFADWAGMRMFRVGPDGRIRGVAGTGRNKPRMDNKPALEVSINVTGQMALGPKGEVVFFDLFARAIREFLPGGLLRTFVGQEPKTSPRVMNSRLDMATGRLTALSIDAQGVAWFASGKELQRVDFVTAHRLSEAPFAEAPGCAINHLAHSKSGGILVACETEGEFRVYASAGAKPLVLKRHVSAAVFDTNGSVVFAEGNRIYRMEAGQAPVHVAGVDTHYGDGGPAAGAWLSGPHGVTVDRGGNILIADQLHHLVRRLRPDGMMETLAGNGEAGSTGDGGPGEKARLGEPVAVAAGRAGEVFVLGGLPPAIRRVGPDGRIGTVWRNGDGGATLSAPTSLVLDGEGRIVFADAEQGRIFRLESDGRVAVIAGTGYISNSRVTGPGRTTALGAISGLSALSDGGILFTQSTGSNLLRRLTLDGRVEILAGNDDGYEMQSGARRALELGLQEPAGAAELSGEGILVSSAYQMVLVQPDGMAVRYASSDDMNQAYAGIGVDENQNAYVADYGSGVLRIVRRKGGVAASPHRVSRMPLPFKPLGRPVMRIFDYYLLWIGFALAPLPFVVRRWRYRRQKARLLRGVDSDLSAVFSPGAASPSPRAAVAGVLEGRYRIVECVANGGSAVVYRAEDLRNQGRMVAVKVFDLPDEDPVAVQRRLLRECVASSRVRHVSVAPMLDVGMTADGQPFLVMEFVEGESLRALLRRGLMDRCVAVRLLGELADAVAATHGQGVLHLDIKPENLMVRAENGRLVLIDFGLAAVAEGGALATHMSSVGGTLDYMAPEQLMGHVSAGADIYACGAVALEMLAGKRVAELELPPNNQDLALTAARVRAAVTGVPEEAVVVLARMLSLRPEERPTGLAELVRALG